MGKTIRKVKVRNPVAPLLRDQRYRKQVMEDKRRKQLERDLKERENER